jgi:hypothetical protein
MPSSGMLRRVAFVRTDVSNERIAECCVLWLLVIVNFVHSSPILVTLTMEAICSSDTSVLIRATWRNFPQDGIVHSHCLENLKSYIALTGWVL